MHDGRGDAIRPSRFRGRALAAQTRAEPGYCTVYSIYVRYMYSGAVQLLSVERRVRSSGRPPRLPRHQPSSRRFIPRGCTSRRFRCFRALPAFDTAQLPRLRHPPPTKSTLDNFICMVLRLGQFVLFRTWTGRIPGVGRVSAWPITIVLPVTPQHRLP